MFGSEVREREEKEQPRPRMLMEKCLIGEEILDEIGLLEADDFESTNPRHRSELIEKRVLFSYLEFYYEMGGVDPADQDLVDHLYLGFLTRHTLAQEEFNQRYDRHPCLDPSWKEGVWRHNLSCPVAFIYLREEIEASIGELRDRRRPEAERVKVAAHLPALLEILESVRQNFDFCEGCKFNRRQARCEFWERVDKKIGSAQEESDILVQTQILSHIFKRVAVPCRIPKTIQRFED